jgi:hypothetical protein
MGRTLTKHHCEALFRGLTGCARQCRWVPSVPSAWWRVGVGAVICETGRTNYWCSPPIHPHPHSGIATRDAGVLRHLMMSLAQCRGGGHQLGPVIGVGCVLGLCVPHRRHAGIVGVPTATESARYLVGVPVKRVVSAWTAL